MYLHYALALKCTRFRCPHPPAIIFFSNHRALSKLLFVHSGRQDRENRRTCQPRAQHKPVAARWQPPNPQVKSLTSTTSANAAASMTLSGVPRPLPVSCSRPSPCSHHNTTPTSNRHPTPPAVCQSTEVLGEAKADAMLLDVRRVMYMLPTVDRLLTDSTHVLPADTLVRRFGCIHTLPMNEPHLPSCSLAPSHC